MLVRRMFSIIFVAWLLTTVTLSASPAHADPPVLSPWGICTGCDLFSASYNDEDLTGVNVRLLGDLLRAQQH